MREAYIQNLKRVFKSKLERSGRIEAAFELFTERDLVETGYQRGRIPKKDYEDLMNAFNLIEQALDLRLPAPHPTLQ
ncbi:MAG: hypothetical protein DMG24_04010 [Acidobacteria bacterium]|nr:MAG: hypothetical protein DMG24_04010 [Acidobacteriota bacterium]